MATRLGTLRTVIADRRLRRINLSYVGFSLAEFATWWATLVYAFEQGGVQGTGRLAVVSLVTAMVVAPFAAWSGDRFRPDRALVVAYLVQSALMAATAAAMYLGAVVLAYASAALVVSAVTVTRPLISSLLPLVVSRPADLVAGNVVIGSIGQIGLFLGPLSAAALMAAESPALVFAASAAVIALGAVLLGGRNVEHRQQTTLVAGTAGAGVLAGLRSVVSARPLAAIVALVFTGALVRGVAEVAIVTFSDQRLGRGGGAVGVLGAAIGLGGLVGIVAATGSADRSRIATRLVAASAAIGLPIATLAATDQPLLAIALLSISGIGMGTIAVLGTVVIQRLASEDTLARVFGVQEAARMAALAVGAGLGTATIDGLGLGPALVWLGAGTTVLAAMCTVGFIRSGADIPPPQPEIVDRIVSDPVFAPLGVRAIEQLAAGAEATVWPAGAAIIAEGDVGRSYFLVLGGEAEVRAGGVLVRRLGPGDSFGEIALLEDRPRTATVRAIDEVTALTIDRDRFLTAVTGHPRSFEYASAWTDRYLR